MHRALPLALLLALPGCAAAQAAPPGPGIPPPPPTAAPPPPAPGAPRFVHVSGEARIAVRPDIAVVVAGVEATGKDLAQVTAAVNGQIRKVMAALREAGVAEKDVLTTRHDVQVNRSWKDGNPGPITGYTVVDELRVKVRDVSRLGAVLDRVVAAGANALRGLAFEKEDPSAERRAALAQAVAAARAKAEVIAKAAGVTLGDVLSVSEGAPQPPAFPNVRMAMMKEADGAAISPGEIELSASVDVFFAIR